MAPRSPLEAPLAPRKLIVKPALSTYLHKIFGVGLSSESGKRITNLNSLIHFRRQQWNKATRAGLAEVAAGGNINMD